MKIPVTIIKHLDYIKRSSQLQLISDACSATGVKDAGNLYLPTTGDMADPLEVEKYKNYKNRATYYGFSGQTLRGMAGLAFMKGVHIVADPQLEYIIDDLDGDGVGLEQSMKASFTGAYRDGRAGLLVDFPPVESGLTKAQQEAQSVRSIIRRYEAVTICNWHIERVGAVNQLTLVSLAEEDDTVAEDGITINRVSVERRLLLKDGLYNVEVYQDGNLIEQYQPKINDQPLSYIPFFFIGAENNDYRFDDSPMFPICDLNISHYRNSADYEDSVFMLRPQPWASGITDTWYNEMLKGFRFGSGSLFPLPEGGSFGIEQPAPNDQAYEAMQYKQKAMVALGAKHLTGEFSYNTATEAMMGEAGSNSVVQTAIDNVELAYTEALAVLAQFMGINDYPTVMINADLSHIVADPQLAGIIVNAWVGGLIGEQDARDYMRKTGLLDRTDDEIDEALAEQVVKGLTNSEM